MKFPKGKRSAEAAGQSQALVEVAPQDHADWHKLWLTLERSNWSSLALVPASKGVSVLELARTLGSVAGEHRQQTTRVEDLSELVLSEMDWALARMSGHVRSGDRVILALRAVSENPTTVSMAKAASAAVLCVTLGETDMKTAEATLSDVGRSHFLGSVVLRPTGAPRGSAR
jgi:hypothetical protein